MKRILLLGDSIRQGGYEPYVRERLAGLAEVVAPGENGRFSFYTLWRRLCRWALRFMI
ncbi:hypothetical protein [Paenibacillus sp. LC231]|uniref:hypothetical protein n=1 Tax=Paenibacillus sp. LC231 TaxID=1120679 RepID=UPI001F374ABF|nr:hypothetical protein [Paenibacillus sp. LC231]